MSDTAVEISTCPAKVYYRHKKGDTWEPETITVSDGGTPVNFTGATGTFTFSNPVNGTTVLTLTTGAGITLSSVGVITLTMTPTQSNAMRLGDFFTELNVILSNGKDWTIVNGIFEHVDKNL